MAASTITRATITDGTGGTPFSSAFFGTAIYDNVDALLSAALNIGGVFTAEGFGTNTFSAGGTGSQLIAVRNTSAGTSMLGGLHVGNDTQANMGRLEAYSSTYTASGAAKVNGVALRAMGVGGLALSAEHNTGEVYIYAFGGTKSTTYNGDYYVVDAPTSGQYSLAGVLDGSRNTTTVGNVGAGEDDLHTFSLPAGTLAVDGHCVQYEAWGRYAANANVKSVRCYFGATLISDPEGSGAVTNGTNWYVSCKIWRTGAATQDAFGVSMSRQNTFTKFTTPSETLSGAVTIKVTGESGNSATDDVVCERSEVTFFP